MKNFRNKEEVLVIFLTNTLRLNKYDQKFLSNLSILLSKNNYVTTNQNDLFNKLLLKYKRQLSKNNVDYKVATALNWNTKLVESLDEYTQAYLSITNNMYKLRIPFNKKCIEKLRDIDKHHNLIWNSKDKCYYADISTETLKIITTIVPQFYPLNLSAELKATLSALSVYNEIKIWNPTLVKIKDWYFIAASNESLDIAIKEYELSNDPNLLFKLSRYGITIDKSVTLNDPFFEFAGKYSVTIDIDDMYILQYYCKLLGIKNVICHARMSRIPEIKKQIDDVLKINGLNIYFEHTNTNLNTSSKQYDGASIFLYHGTNEYIKYMYLMRFNISKIVGIVNNRPVKVK